MEANLTSDWQKTHYPIYQGLTDIARSTVESLLKSKGIDYLTVTSRTKTTKSIFEKITRKDYKSTDEITDISAIRIITYVESEVRAACEVIENAFKVLAEDSLDKSEELDEDQVGYRSVHYVCELGRDRENLPELKIYKGLRFEIQVRTVLQHAWAEIEHDRSYKFAGVLPKSIKRRLYLLSGTLELVDTEFSRLVRDIKKYESEISEKAISGNLNIEITSASLESYFSTKFNKARIQIPPPDSASLNEIVLGELSRFGINTLQDLDNILDENTLHTITAEPSFNMNGLLRRAMLHTDAEKYFSTAWNRSWEHITPGSKAVLIARYGMDATNEMIERHLIDDEYEFD